MIQYFDNTPFVLGKNDCWTLLQKIYKNEHNFDLPDFPVCDTRNDNIRANLILTPVEKAEKGCLINYFHIMEHAGYALNSKEFIHRTLQGVKVSDIPKKANIYKIEGVK